LPARMLVLSTSSSSWRWPNVLDVQASRLAATADNRHIVAGHDDPRVEDRRNPGLSPALDQPAGRREEEHHPLPLEVLQAYRQPGLDRQRRLRQGPGSQTALDAYDPTATTTGKPGDSDRRGYMIDGSISSIRTHNRVPLDCPYHNLYLPGYRK